MKISNELIPIVYNILKKVFEGEISHKQGKEIISEDGRMNTNSAADFINNFRRLLEGEKFTRTNNTYSTDYFLQHIYKDYGSKGLSNALKALNHHIKYYEEKQNTTMHTIRGVYSKHLQIFSINSDELELNYLDKFYKKQNKTKQEIVTELKQLKPTDSELITITSKSFKRDNATIAKIKILRDYRCQICSTRITKKDGTYYIEAAHIKPKHLNGSETPDNIILLCPNHHKEFDYGDLQITKHTSNLLEFSMNGVPYSISLKIELINQNFSNVCSI